MANLAKVNSPGTSVASWLAVEVKGDDGGKKNNNKSLFAKEQFSFFFIIIKLCFMKQTAPR